MKKVKNGFNELKSILESSYGEDVSKIVDYLRSKGARYVDEGIDDGGDVEGEYIMYVVFQYEKKDIKMYYSNLDEKISYIFYRD